MNFITYWITLILGACCAGTIYREHQRLHPLTLVGLIVMLYFIGYIRGMEHTGLGWIN